MRRIRPHVIDHAVEYEWSYFQEQLRLNLVELDKTEFWLKGCLEEGDIFGISKIGTGDLSRSQSLSQMPKSSSSLNLAAADNMVGKGSFTDLYYRSLLSLIMTFKKENVPETFSLDITRLTGLHNDWQDITILVCLLVLYKQSLGAKATFNEIKSMKEQLWILLNDQETTLPHINLHLLSNAEKVRGAPFNETEKKSLAALIDKTLSPESPLYDLMQKRIGLHLFSLLQSGSVIKDLLGKHSLLELETEIENLGQKIKPFAEHNRLVYASVYNELIKKLQS